MEMRRSKNAAAVWTRLAFDELLAGPRASTRRWAEADMPKQSRGRGITVRPLVPEPVTFEDDERLGEWGFGITNLIARATPGIDTLERVEHAPAHAGVGIAMALDQGVECRGIGEPPQGDRGLAALPATFRGILERLRQRYVLGFVPSSSVSGWHDLDVRVKRPNVKVVARRGYVRR
jgi:hypothetical protein